MKRCHLFGRRGRRRQLGRAILCEPRRPSQRSALGTTMLAVLFLQSPALAAEPSEEAAPEAGGMAEVVACVKGNAPKKSVMQVAKLTTVDGTGADRSFEAKLS